VKSLRVQVDQDRVRQLGVSSKSLAEAIVVLAILSSHDPGALWIYRAGRLASSLHPPGPPCGRPERFVEVTMPSIRANSCMSRCGALLPAGTYFMIILRRNPLALSDNALVACHC